MPDCTKRKKKAKPQGPNVYERIVSDEVALGVAAAERLGLPAPEYPANPQPVVRHSDQVGSYIMGLRSGAAVIVYPDGSAEATTRPATYDYWLPSELYKQYLTQPWA